MKKYGIALGLALCLFGSAQATPWMDITLTVDQDKTPVYPGDPPIHFSRVKSLDNGDVATVSKLEMGAHTGTHIDAPSHFIKGGKNIDEIPLETLMGPALVIECSPEASIVDAAELNRHKWRGHKRILFKTHNSYANFYDDTTFHKDAVAIAPDAAQLLVDNGVILVCIDYLSAEKFGSAAPRTHQILLGKGVVIVEGIELRKIKAGNYDLICLPARLKRCEAAPTRALLRPL
jgi:arylformamidase